MRRYLSFFLSLVISSSVAADTVDINKPEIFLKVTTEDSQKVILATVTTDGKPLANVTVNFFVKRTFGNLGIGHDQTVDDGTAAVPFPVDLPGGTTGQIQVIAVITNPSQYGSVRSEATFDGARVISPQAQAFPRTLWAPRAPLSLILTIVILVTVVWCTYVYVVIQLIRIRNGGTQ
jgi:hypothetical protein